MQTSKLVSYFGFARRAGKLTTGVGACETLKKAPCLLAADENVAKHSRKAIESLQRRWNCPLLFFPDLGSLVGRAGCKCAAVREEHLAKAIMACSE